MRSTFDCLIDSSKAPQETVMELLDFLEIAGLTAMESSFEHNFHICLTIRQN